MSRSQPPAGICSGVVVSAPVLVNLRAYRIMYGSFPGVQLLSIVITSRVSFRESGRGNDQCLSGVSGENTLKECSPSLQAIRFAPCPVAVKPGTRASPAQTRLSRYGINSQNCRREMLYPAWPVLEPASSETYYKPGESAGSCQKNQREIYFAGPAF
jgi:hypothetical protein